MARKDPPGDSGLRDLGFGTVVATESKQRLLNRDGTFNVERVGLGFRGAVNVYHSLVRTTWPRFVLMVALLYVATNLVFAAAYLACGANALAGQPASVDGGRFPQAFFFSVQTLSSVGYGHIIPVGFAANSIVVVESIAGLFFIALVAGLSFARFSRPSASILFSKCAVIAPYNDITAFMFRIANLRKSELLDVNARVRFSRMEQRDGESRRAFYLLRLERGRVAFFPLSWTIVHPIDEESPLYGLDEGEFGGCNAEFLILLNATDETFTETVHARSSYKADEVLWGARFTDIMHHPEGDEPISVDVSRLHDIEPA